MLKLSLKLIIHVRFADLHGNVNRNLTAALIVFQKEIKIMEAEIYLTAKLRPALFLSFFNLFGILTHFKENFRFFHFICERTFRNFAIH